jgi:hypothetical protein
MRQVLISRARAPARKRRRRQPLDEPAGGERGSGQLLDLDRVLARARERDAAGPGLRVPLLRGHEREETGEVLEMSLRTVSGVAQARTWLRAELSGRAPTSATWADPSWSRIDALLDAALARPPADGPAPGRGLPR